MLVEIFTDVLLPPLIVIAVITLSIFVQFKAKHPALRAAGKAFNTLLLTGAFAVFLVYMALEKGSVLATIVFLSVIGLLFALVWLKALRSLFQFVSGR